MHSNRSETEVVTATPIEISGDVGLTRLLEHSEDSYRKKKEGSVVTHQQPLDRVNEHCASFKIRNLEILEI